MSGRKRLWLGVAIYAGVVLLSLLIGGMLSVLPAEANEGLVEASGLTREALAAATQAYARGAFMQVNVQRTQEFRSEEHTSELQSIMRISYAGFRLKKQT